MEMKAYLLSYAEVYVGTLRNMFIEDVYPESHRLFQDDDPKHTSR